MTEPSESSDDYVVSDKKLSWWWSPDTSMDMQRWALRAAEPEPIRY